MTTKTNELLNEMFTKEEMETVCKCLLNQMQRDLIDFLLNFTGSDKTEEEIKTLVENDDEFIKITKNAMMNAVHHCNFEKIIVLTLIEMQNELDHFSINIVPLNKSVEHGLS